MILDALFDMESKDNLNYCILLSPSQVKFLSDPLQGTSRCATLLSMIAMARIEEEKGDGDVAIHVGQLSAPITRLADQWSVNPKTARKLILHFNDQSLVRTESGPSGSIHTILCLSGWIRDGQTIRNPYYQRPETSNASVSEGVSSEVDHTDSHDTRSFRIDSVSIESEQYDDR